MTKKKDEKKEEVKVEEKKVVRGNPARCPSCGLSGIVFPFREEVELYFCPNCRAVIY